MTNSLTVTNTGNAQSWPVLWADGPLAMAQWAMGESVVRWEGTLPIGQRLEVDGRYGSVTVGGVDMGGRGLVRAEFFQIPPGSSAISFMANQEASWGVAWQSANI